MSITDTEAEGRGKTKTSHAPLGALPTNGPVGEPDVHIDHAPKARKARKPIPANETKRSKFKRVAGHRTNEILHRLEILITMGRNRTSYEYDNADVARIIAAIRAKVDVLEHTIKVPDANREKFEV